MSVEPSPAVTCVATPPPHFWYWVSDVHLAVVRRQLLPPGSDCWFCAEFVGLCASVDEQGLMLIAGAFTMDDADNSDTSRDSGKVSGKCRGKIRGADSPLNIWLVAILLLKIEMKVGSGVNKMTSMMVVLLRALPRVL